MPDMQPQRHLSFFKVPKILQKVCMCVCVCVCVRERERGLDRVTYDDFCTEDG